MSHPIFRLANVTALAVLAITFTAANAAASPAEATEGTAAMSALEETWGVRVIGIRLSAAGHILDFRYRVIDAEKAAPIMNRRLQPQLIIEQTGVKLSVPVGPTVGPMRQAPKFPQAGRNYFMLFSNPGHAAKPGDRVTVQIGDFRAEHLTIVGAAEHMEGASAARTRSREGG